MRTLFFPTLLIAVLAIPLSAWGAAEFQPLTNLPGISQAASSNTLPLFLNNLYRLCIGAAAVIAILQIMRAGMYFMFNKGSIAHNEQAKSLIMNSVLGLLLVLSPTIVFTIINPDILELELDTSKLQPDTLPIIDGSGTAATADLTPIIAECRITNMSGPQKACLNTKAANIRSSYRTCVTGRSATEIAACRSNAQQSFATAAADCPPALAPDKLACIRDKFITSVTTVCQPGSGSGGCGTPGSAGNDRGGGGGF